MSDQIIADTLARVREILARPIGQKRLEMTTYGTPEEQEVFRLMKEDPEYRKQAEIGLQNAREYARKNPYLGIANTSEEPTQ